MGEDGFAGEAFDAVGERALDRCEAGLGSLDLPSMEVRAIVGERQLPVGRCGHYATVTPLEIGNQRLEIRDES